MKIKQAVEGYCTGKQQEIIAELVSHNYLADAAEIKDDIERECDRVLCGKQCSNPDCGGKCRRRRITIEITVENLK